MAAIFQIRRGSGSVLTLQDGELYLHEQSRSIYVGTDNATNIQLAKLDAVNTGSFNVTGDITLAGNIYLGDSLANDSVNVNSPFSGSIIPSGSNVFDLGSNTYKYRNVYATSISGAIAATNGVISGSSQLASVFEEKASTTHTLVSGSSQIIGILESLNSFTGSYATTGSNTFRGNQSITGSVSISNGQFNIITGSGALTSSLSFRHTTIDPITGNAILELRYKNNDVGPENNAWKFMASDSGVALVFEQEGVDRTLLTSNNAGDALIFRDTRLYGKGLTVDNNLSVSQNTQITGSLIVLGGITGSLTGSVFGIGDVVTFSSSVDTSVTSLNSYTSSLRTAITASGTNVTINGNLTVKGTTTQIDSTTLNIGDNIIELNYGGSQTLSGIYTKDATGTLSSGSLLWNSTTDSWIAGVSGSESKILLAGGDSIISSSAQLVDLNSFTSSTNIRLTNLESTTSSLNISVSNINTTTASLNTSVSNINSFTSSTNGRLTNLESKSASVDISITNINNTTASLNTSVTNINSFTGSQLTQNDNLATISGSLIISASTAKTTNDTQDGRLTNLESKSSSVDISVAALNSYTTSISTSFGAFSSSYNTDSASFNYRISILDPGNISLALISIQQTTASLNIFTASIAGTNAFTTSTNVRLNNIEAATSSYETNGRGIVSGSSQIVPLLPTGVVSGSLQILGGSGVWSSSTQMPAGVISGSSQILGGTGIVSGSSQITPLLPTGVISGSSQILGGSTIHSSSIGDYQFNSIGVGTAASITAGEIRAIGDITAFYSSDIRLKENIQPIENALLKIESISGNTYDWKEGYEEIHSHKGNDVGVIAQEIEEILPQIVTNRDNGYKAVQYEKIIPLLIEAIKELSVKIKRLENK
jgi:hypothetical protein